MKLSSRNVWLSIFCLIALIVGVGVGILVYHEVYGPAKAAAKPIIGVIRIYGYLLTDTDRDLYLKCINYAIQNDSIVGVIVRIDSPGGYATIVEDLYHSIRELSEIKPTIAVVEGIAASGGYYVALATNEIVAVPTSFVGNIGVILRQPYIAIPSEAVIETGPYKYTGLSLKETPFTVREALRNFLSAVNASRGDKLRISIEELILGKLYLSSEAIEYGLIDELGSYATAIAEISRKTGVEEYVLIDLNDLLSRSSANRTLGQELWHRGELLSLELISSLHPEPLSLYYLSPFYIKSYSLIEPLTAFNFKFNTTFHEETTTSPINSNSVLIDISHGNFFTYELLSRFFGELIEHGFKVVLFDLTQIENLPSNVVPHALIIISPRAEYSSAEVNFIKRLVDKGCKLILIYDPSITSSRYINSLANAFGMHFSDGYLYDLNCNYGVYRNIIVRKFADHILTKGVRKLTLFTASHIYGGDVKLAITNASTKSILTDRAGEYAPLVINGNVIAIADLTFMLDPFITISDNEVFMKNMVKFIEGR